MSGREEPTAVVAALPEEARPLLSRLRGREPATPPRGRPTGERPWIVRGRLAGRSVAVVTTGDGERNARRGVRRAIETLRPARLVAIGAGGGLDPGLLPGSLVVGARVGGPDGRWLAAEPSLVARAAAAGAREGIVITVDRLLDTPEAKAALRAAAAADGTPGGGAAPDGARPVPDIADLESAFYAGAAREAGLPWLVLRSVSDAAFDRLPSYLERCRDAGGGVRRGAVLRGALLRPWAVPGLLRLARRVRLGGERLADLVEAVVASGGADP